MLLRFFKHNFRFMKILFSLALICFFNCLSAQSKDSLARQPHPGLKILTVDAACGQCQFEMKGNGCTLAVRLNGKTYFVEGTDIDSHGDAHADDGFCKAVRKANVQGEVLNNRFKVSYFKLLKP